MIPLKGLALEHHGYDDCEHCEGYDLLNDFELHDVERSAVAVEADPVGRNLGAVLEKCHSSGQQNDQNQRPSGRNLHLLKFQMPVPGECHEDVGCNQ